MKCTQCNGSGIMDLPHVPSVYGGYMNARYNFSGVECGACFGSGYLGDAITFSCTRPDPVLDKAPTPSNREQYSAQVKRLFEALTSAEFIARPVGNYWIEKINKFDANTSFQEAISELAGIRSELMDLRRRAQPSDPFNIDMGMKVEKEVYRIDSQLAGLIRILQDQCSL